MDDLKDFDKWNEAKKHIHGSTRKKSIKEQRIYWVSIGRNIGKEIYGKNSYYTRPVLIIKITPNGFWGVPLTSTLGKINGFHYPFEDDKGKLQVATLEQLRFFDVKRVQTLMSKISNKDFVQIKILLKDIMGD